MVNLQFGTTKEFSDFKNALSAKLGNYSIKQAEHPDFKPSAVMILLFLKDNRVQVLLTKRTNLVRTHKGEVSLPGGAFDQTDSDFLTTALRETYEEVGVRADDIEIIGEFDEFISLYGYHVHTYIGAIRFPYHFVINTHEIEEYFEAPLDIFINKECSRTEIVDHQGTPFTMYYYDYAGSVIWGLTARILTDFGAFLLDAGIVHHTTVSDHSLS